MKRFLDKEHERLRKTPRFKEVKVNFLNTTIKAPDASSLLFLNKELFEQKIYKFKSQNKTPFIIDCGANIGLSIIYFKNLYPQSEIIAFEPDKNIFQYLKYNINSFKYNDVQLINKALWDKETNLHFTPDGSDGGRIEMDVQNAKQYTIQATKLSNYLIKKIDFLKIDIEGAELIVLQEIENKLFLVDNLFIEFHSFQDKPQVLSKILKILENNNFRYYIEQIGIKSKDPFIFIHNSSGFDNQLNIFAYKDKG